ncbi:MAG: SixA phosphatase family protein [Deferrisomatales bacterium]
MKRLTLVRHAKSSWADGSLTDFDRPLNGRGKRDAPEIGRRLAARGVAPDAVVTSPAVRARKTARKLAAELGFPPGEIREAPEIYDAELETLVALVRGLDDAWDRVLLVGHNPGFTDLANWLTGGALANLPTCGALGVELGVEAWGELRAGGGTPAFYDTPKDGEG